MAGKDEDTRKDGNMVEDDHVNEYEDYEDQEGDGTSPLLTGLKLFVAAAFMVSAVRSQLGSDLSAGMASPVAPETSWRRRLTTVDGVPSYMNHLVDELKERKKLMEKTPPEEVKYWFEYTGALQKYYYRYSKSRGKADSFEGRDDSGVLSSRFVEEAGGGAEYKTFFAAENIPDDELSAHTRLIDNCLSMGHPARPSAEKGTFWNDWFGSKDGDASSTMDRCRILFTLNTVGAGRGPTMLWETNPPALHGAGPKPWISEQETAATHLERNLQEIDAMCATGQIAARVQILVCEPIPGKWTDWMDSMLPNCGGQPKPFSEPAAKVEGGNPYDGGIDVEERPSPIQVVVVASATTADTCHDLKSGFMEKRMQDLVLAPPYISSDKKDGLKGGKFDPAKKTTHPDLVSSDDHDLYVAMKWSSLVSVRTVSSFLQASADISAAAASPNNQEAAKPEKSADGVTVSLSNSPSSPFLIPSFVRVSYVSEENSKVAKWRMHGDFFHPAAWEICKDSYDMTWIPDSLSGAGGVNGICYGPGARALGVGEECGQWWVYMAEEQMPTTPEVYANEVTAPLVQGGSNYIWMLTERQRQEIVKQKVCEYEHKDDKEASCGELPQAVLPLGDLQSFLVNFTPNTALGKKHNTGRRPGYSKEKEREHDREMVRERKQLKGQEDIEKALFDYTVYPSALFHKDATVKAARARDMVLTKKADHDENKIGPQTVKSSYYDVTITKPREATSAWCQHIGRRGLCTLYADYFRLSSDKRCKEACGLSKNWTKMPKEEVTDTA
eukprot:CAMPEP_0183293264 /NCGR_PEP_ID=MMETSP0160_2-20130417/2015_1 /TAXON_ID=2839 ORGANISM="Odontella Sinensis, Strain Grunow 1884" /NCGR_SAMPLE_ID=MMETSP0160_2 /ASSEMBLY_ACC=CAM_ASM_000250 /LENGTH=782 /DNA_ID=CAMNT_0025454351 /DNA_START=44 /DNA_END=2392 /DNA_ORIENTATION=-